MPDRFLVGLAALGLLAEAAAERSGSSVPLPSSGPASRRRQDSPPSGMSASALPSGYLATSRHGRTGEHYVIISGPNAGKSVSRKRRQPLGVMISGLLKKALYIVGRTMAALIWLGALGGLALAYGGSPGATQPWQLFLPLLLAIAAGTVAHELGHMLACLAVGAEIKAFQLGDERGAIRFHVRRVQVSLGWPYRGRVQYGGILSVGRRVVITLAGSLMNLALGGLVLWLAVPASGQSTRGVVVAVALGLGVPGLVNLMPFRTRSGRLSDGARLFEVRSDVRAAKVLEARKAAPRLLRAGRATELLELHAGLNVPAGRMSVPLAARLTVVEFNVVLLPGLPADAARLAESRVSSLLRFHDLGTARPVAHLTLALLRLRLSEQGSQAEAERLCVQALAPQDVRDSLRRMALAAVIVSRQVRGLAYEDVCERAAATLATVKPGPEEMAPGLRAIVDPEGTLDAFRSGAPDARLGVRSLAVMLRRQDRIGKLLELHAGFGVPEGHNVRELAQSLHEIECNLLLVPGVQRAEIDEAANRVAWILDNYPFEAEGSPMPRAAVEHTLALARLRQGRFEEVEPLCASGLAGDFGPDVRATILATITLARRALGQSHADLLRAAMALSPGADLVAEAALGTADGAAVGNRRPSSEYPAQGLSGESPFTIALR